MTEFIKESLTCPICNRAGLQNLTAHITRGHKISKEQFIKEYPNMKLFTDTISKNCSKAWHLGYATHLNDHDFISEFTKRAAKTRSLRQDEICRKIVETRRKNNSYHTDLVKRWHENKEYRELKIQQTKNQHKNGLTDIIVSKSGRKRYNIILNDKKYSMRSTWETKVAKFLFDNKIEFKFEPFTVNYDFNGKIKKYYPDFYLPQYNLILEVKPKSLLKYDMAQCKKCACLNLGYKFIFITEDEINCLNTINFEGI